METIPGYCSCGNSVEGTTNRCSQCNRADRKRAAEAVNIGGRKIYRIKSVSDKRTKEMGEYKKVKDAYLEEFPLCECCTTARSVEIHHKAGRENKRLIDFKMFLAVCRPCHREIETNPDWAIQAGFSEKRN